MPLRHVTTFVLVLAGAFAVGLSISGRTPAALPPGTQAPQPRARAPVTPPAPTSPAVAASQLGLPDFSGVAERTVPVVVNISARQLVRRSNSPFTNDPFFSAFGAPDDIFGSSERVESSLGSGVIVSPDGYILTNNHVVTGEARRLSLRDLDVAVSLADKRELPAVVVGTDPSTDLALLKIDARNLPTMPWGDSSRLRVAEWVLAIGNPYQLNQSVSLGIVSAVGRTNLGVSAYEDFIQTDAAINPGNSGGALINGRGELVGINTVIFSQSGGYQGIGFAVSSNLAKRVMNDLRQHGEVRRGSIGYVELEPLTTQQARSRGMSDTAGLLVTRMARASSAYNGGLRPGDVVRTFNGTPISDAGQLWRFIQDATIDGTVVVGVLREGRPTTLKIAVVRRTANY
jgi:Do/DeqQ family serine protease